MPRLAWFSPMPPVRSGIASYSAEVIADLRNEHHIDVYVDASSKDGLAQLESPYRPQSAHDFVWQHHKQPYDLTIFQVGNSSYHDFLWPYLFRYPGLAVLHDAHLHHARAAALLRQKRAGHYRDEFAANEPDLPRDFAELAVAGFDTHLLYSATMTRLVVESSRVTAVHAPGLLPQLREQSPQATLETIRLGHGQVVDAEHRAVARSRVRRALGLSEATSVFGVFGGISPEKRIPQILDAVGQVRRYIPDIRLLLAGAAASHYDLAADIRGRGLQDLVLLTGYIETDDDLTDHLAACDVSLNLRWPTAREVSGPWLRALAAGVPTVTLDLAHLADVPSLDPRTWAPAGCQARMTPDAAEAVTVTIDILDEQHSLQLAMRRLGSDAELRSALGTAGQRYWTREHSHDVMLADYRRVIAAALNLDAPSREDGRRPRRAAGLPTHLTDDGTAIMEALLAPFGFTAEDPRRLRVSDTKE
jgi:glycosyltransferase involved in cell wall biosynthesis